MRTPYYIYIACAIILASWLPTRAHSAEAPKREIRAVWVTTLQGLDWPRTKATSPESRERQQAELREIMDRLQAANINTILLQTRVRGTVIYPSDIEPWDGALTGTIGRDPGYDPLRFAIDEAHRRGMELHAWVVTIPCFKVAVARQMGTKSVLKTHPTLCRRHGDTYYLDPGVPGTADYLVRICHEIVERYDVDGIHLDYIRYPEGATSFADAPTFKRYAPKGQAKNAWRKDNITRIVRHLYNDIHTLKPWVRISSSPVGKYADLARYSSRGWNARDAVHQDAEGWMHEGIHDILFPMMYFDGNQFYPFAADWQEQSAGRLVAPGLGIYFLHPQEKNWPLTTITRQLHYLRDMGLAGQCYFRSRFLTDDVKGLYGYLKDFFYPHPALLPACTWIDSIAPSCPALDKAGRMHATDDQHGGVFFNVYASQKWPVDTQSPENLVAARLSSEAARKALNVSAKMGIHMAITAMDRCGNESEGLQLSEAPNLPEVKGLLRNDGRRLFLPKVQGQFVLITDLAGRTVLRARPTQEINIARLRDGFYRVDAIQGKEKRARRGHVGEFWKYSGRRH